MVQEHSDLEQRTLDLETLRNLAREKHYSVRSHTVDHMFKEDFGERHIIDVR